MLILHPDDCVRNPVLCSFSENDPRPREAEWWSFGNQEDECFSENPAPSLQAHRRTSLTMRQSHTSTSRSHWGRRKPQSDISSYRNTAFSGCTNSYHYSRRNSSGLFDRRSSSRNERETWALLSRNGAEFSDRRPRSTPSRRCPSFLSANSSARHPPSKSPAPVHRRMQLIAHRRRSTESGSDTAQNPGDLGPPRLRLLSDLWEGVFCVAKLTNIEERAGWTVWLLAITSRSFLYLGYHGLQLAKRQRGIRPARPP